MLGAHHHTLLWCHILIMGLLCLSKHLFSPAHSPFPSWFISVPRTKLLIFPSWRSCFPLEILLRVLNLNTNLGSNALIITPLSSSYHPCPGFATSMYPTFSLVLDGQWPLLTPFLDPIPVFATLDWTGQIPKASLLLPTAILSTYSYIPHTLQIPVSVCAQ